QRSGAFSQSIRPWESGSKEFRTHLDVTSLVATVLEECLPFGRRGVSLPTRFVDAFRVVDQLEGWLVRTLDGRPHPGSPGLLVLGLAFTATARAYLADIACALVGVALPLHRLYEERRAAILTKLSTQCDAEPRSSPILTKRSYNSLMAVGLLELLTGKPMAHMDPATGDGYMRNAGGLQLFSPLEPLVAFWGSVGTIHQEAVSDIRGYQQSPVLQVLYDQTRAKQNTAWLAPITFEDLSGMMLDHAFPVLKLSDQPSNVQAKGAPLSGRMRLPTDGPSDSNHCRHFITLLR